MTDLGPLTDDELGAALRDLGENLALPDVDLVSDVRRGLAEPPSSSASAPRPPLAAVAAAVVVIALGAVLAIAPARSAVADWLGIGRTAVEVDNDPPAATQPLLPAASGEEITGDDIRADADVDFVVRLPDPALVGEVEAWEVRGADGSGRLVVVYDGLVLSARATDADAPLALKTVPTDAAITEATSRGGLAVLWIGGEHVREVGGVAEVAGSTLLWVQDGVEWRLEGAADLATALAVADSLS